MKRRIACIVCAALLAAAAFPAYADTPEAAENRMIEEITETEIEDACVELIAEETDSEEEMLGYYLGTEALYRVYNPNSGEHFYTASKKERDHLASIGWSYEGIGWFGQQDASIGKPVYRLYNASGGEHHYTMNKGEKDNLVKVGWKDEGIGWYSCNEENGVPVYRQYNPNAYANNHNYTTNKGEKDYLIKHGWKDEGIGWYGGWKYIGMDAVDDKDILTLQNLTLPQFRERYPKAEEITPAGGHPTYKTDMFEITFTNDGEEVTALKLTDMSGKMNMKGIYMKYAFSRELFRTGLEDQFNGSPTFSNTCIKATEDPADAAQILLIYDMKETNAHGAFDYTLMIVENNYGWIQSAKIIFNKEAAAMG
ncbi:MAG: hypothetical protein Q4B22_02450 [Eubacteriales bacterium]|nr:hypothetical protein [Eubacteriales bacterium]